MSKYQFRLETVRRLRVAQRDQHRTALADAYRAEQVLAEQRTVLDEEKAVLRSWQRDAIVAAHVDVNQLLESQRYEMVLKAKGDQLADRAARLAIEVERRRQTLVEADRSVRVLELLDDRKRREHRRREQRQEVKQLDEVAMTRRRAE